jgi:hypothetical protein
LCIRKAQEEQTAGATYWNPGKVRELPAEAQTLNLAPLPSALGAHSNAVEEAHEWADIGLLNAAELKMTCLERQW